MSKIFKCHLCGSNGERFFSGDGNCLVCEDEGHDDFDEDCNCGEDVCCCLTPSYY